MPIDFKFTGDGNQLVREYEKLEQKMLRLEERNAKLARESKTAHDSGVRGARDHASAASSAASQIGNIVAAYGSVASIVGMVNRTLEENNRLWAQAGQTAIRVAGAQQTALKNLVGLSTGQKQDVLGPQAAAIQKAAAFPDRASIIQAMGAGYSASGDINLTRSAVEAAAELTRLTPQALETVSAGALDVARGSGVTDARQNLAFLLSSGAINRIVDPVALAENLAPLVASGVATVPGQDRQAASLDIGAVFGTLARAATDTTGKTTGSAATKLLGQMESFFATREDPGSVIGRIEALQANPQLRQQFLAGGSFEEKYKIPIRELLTGGSALDAELEASRAAVSFDRSLYDQLQAEISTGTPELVQATSAAAAQARKEIKQLGSGDSVKGNVRQLLKDTMQNSRMSANLTAGPEDAAMMLMYDLASPLLGDQRAASLITQLHGARQRYGFSALNASGISYLPGMGGTQGGQEATAAENERKESLSLLRRMTDALEQLTTRGGGVSAVEAMGQNY